MPDVVLVNPSPGWAKGGDATIEPPLGLASMGAMLERHGYRCAIVDANLERLTPAEVAARIPADTRLVGVSVNSFTYAAARDLVALLKRERVLPVLAGGPVPTLLPEQVLADLGCDAVVRGEGEYVLVRVMAELAAGRNPFASPQPGLALPGAAGGVTGLPPQRIEDLDLLPFPAWQLVPPLGRYRTRSRQSPVAPLITSRGCPFGCSFCSKDVFGREITLRSAENVLAEIDYLVRTFGVRQIDILDDNALIERERFERILDGLIARRYGLSINFQTGVRCELLDDALLDKMKRAGVFKLAFGIETADEELLALHAKELDLGRMERTVASARSKGFLVYGFFIVGLVGETDASFEKTLRFVRRLDLDVANFTIALPFPGTRLYDLVRARGRFLVDTSRNIDAGFYDGTVFYEYDDQSAAQIAARYRRAYDEFYTLPRKLRMLGGIRSWSELSWLVRAWLQVRRSPGSSSPSRSGDRG